jgi:hypothetical protein
MKRMKRIAVLRREGHQLTDDTKECLGHLSRAGIPAHLGKEQPGHGILRVEGRDRVIKRACRILEVCGFQVTDLPPLPFNRH